MNFTSVPHYSTKIVGRCKNSLVDYQGLQNKLLKDLLYNEPNYNIIELT